MSSLNIDFNYWQKTKEFLGFDWSNKLKCDWSVTSDTRLPDYLAAKCGCASFIFSKVQLTFFLVCFICLKHFIISVSKTSIIKFLQEKCPQD